MWPRSRMLFAVRQPISRRCRSSSSTSHGCCGTKRFALSHLTSAATSAPSSFAEPLRRKSRTSRRGVRREKRRGSGVVTGDLLVGEVRDRAVIIFDDLISTGTTLQRAARSCRQAGATRIFAAATHGLFMGQAPTVLADPVFEGVAVTDTVRSVAAAEGRLSQTIVHLDSSKLVADAIIAAHSGR